MLVLDTYFKIWTLFKYGYQFGGALENWFSVLKTFIFTSTESIEFLHVGKKFKYLFVLWTYI